MPLPNEARNTAGTLPWLPNMYAALAAWFTSWSKAVKVKPDSITIGRYPLNAAPTAAPVMTFSAIGVWRDRCAPNSASSLATGAVPM